MDARKNQLVRSKYSAFGQCRAGGCLCAYIRLLLDNAPVTQLIQRNGLSSDRAYDMVACGEYTEAIGQIMQAGDFVFRRHQHEHIMAH